MTYPKRSLDFYKKFSVGEINVTTVYLESLRHIC